MKWSRKGVQKGVYGDQQHGLSDCVWITDHPEEISRCACKVAFTVSCRLGKVAGLNLPRSPFSPTDPLKHKGYSLL
jgi:hypothetical protein